MFVDIFRNYFRTHGHYFEDAPDQMLKGEHNLQYYSLFQDYLKVYEVYGLFLSSSLV